MPEGISKPLVGALLKAP